MSLQIMTLTGMSKKLNILKYKTRRSILGVIFSPFFGIPGDKEGDITGHDRENK